MKPDARIFVPLVAVGLLWEKHSAKLCHYSCS